MKKRKGNSKREEGRDEESVRRGEGKIREEGRPIKAVDGEVGGKGKGGRREGRGGWTREQKRWGEEREGRVVKVAFWNIAGIRGRIGSTGGKWRIGIL